MIELQIVDDTSVTLDTVSVTGPAFYKGDTCTVGANTFTRGYILVDAGAGVQTMPLTSFQMEFLPYAVIIALVLGLLTGRFGTV